MRINPLLPHRPEYETLAYGWRLRWRPHLEHEVDQTEDHEDALVLEVSVLVLHGEKNRVKQYSYATEKPSNDSKKSKHFFKVTI